MSTTLSSEVGSVPSLRAVHLTSPTRMLGKRVISELPFQNPSLVSAIMQPAEIATATESTANGTRKPPPE